MDYPQLNFWFGLALILTACISTGLTVLLSRRDRSSFLWRAIVSLWALSLLAFFYIAFLFSRFMTPAFNLRLSLALLLAGAITAALTAVLYRLPLSPVGQRVMLVALALSLLASFALAYLLYRSLVPAPVVLTSV